jgi:hypothetical protein
MPYIVTAEIILGVEENHHGDISKVVARILSERNGIITVEVPGDFYRQGEITRSLCNSLIDAGFYSFKIGHSY